MEGANTYAGLPGLCLRKFLTEWYMLAGQGRWSKVFQFAFPVVFFFNGNIIASQCCISFVVQESESVIQVCIYGLCICLSISI